MVSYCCCPTTWRIYNVEAKAYDRLLSISWAFCFAYKNCNLSPLYHHPMHIMYASNKAFFKSNIIIDWMPVLRNTPYIYYLLLGYYVSI